MKPRANGLAVLAATAVLAPVLLVAQEHPRYANARTYLRTAQLLMRVPERPNVQLTLKPADDEVDAAIRDIDRAGVVDRKSVVDHPAVKDNMEDVDRFRSIVDLLHAADNELQQEANNSSAEWQIDTVKHIKAALESVHKAAINAHLDRAIGDF